MISSDTQVQAYRFCVAEGNGRYLYALLLAGESTMSLKNVGDGRRKPARWRRITQQAFLRAVKTWDSSIEILDITPRAAQFMHDEAHHFTRNVRVGKAIAEARERGVSYSA